jgi:hypothetical protein
MFWGLAKALRIARPINEIATFGQGGQGSASSGVGYTSDMTDSLADAPAASRLDAAISAITAAAKLVTIGCAIDALLNADSPRLRGKAIRTRAFGYTAGLFIVPVVWRLLPDRGPYPRALDLAVTTPLLLDAAGNALGMYERAHVDDVVHFANAAIVSGVAGALFAPRVDEPWQAALAGAGVAIAGETAWEVAEYGAWRLGQEGMHLTYEDTMADIAESWLGAVVGALFTLTRMRRSKAARTRSGWRGPLGLRETGNG